jgi:AraC-like DNA-binding protein
MDVLFTVGDIDARVVGTMTRAIVATSDAPRTVVGVRFKPGAACEILGVAAHELVDADATLHDLWGAAGRESAGRLAASDATSAIAALRDLVAARASRAPSPDPRVQGAVALLERTGGELPIPAVAASVGIGERQLGRVFEERVGYGPKMLARVVRVRRAADAVAALGGHVRSWAELAVACGYSDQAHLVREMRALAGVTPAAYAREWAAMSEIVNPLRPEVATFGA